MPRPETYKRRDPLARFVEKCTFEPRTGCVIWTGGKTRGRGNTATYGSFWYDGRRWFAHRWAAVFIHGLDVGKLQVGHCCPNNPDGHPNTLCVEHLEAQTQAENIAEQIERLGPPRTRPSRCEQDGLVKQGWLLTERGYEPPPPVHDAATLDTEIPFYEPPDWYRRASGIITPAEPPF